MPTSYSFWYIGSSDVKVIRAGDWNGIGVAGQADTVWNSANGWGIDESLLTVAARNWLADEPDFSRAAADPLARVPESMNTGNNEDLTIGQANTRYPTIDKVDLVIRYNDVQPLRVTATNDPTHRVRWVSSTPPAIGNGYAIDGVDVWENTA